MASITATLEPVLLIWAKIADAIETSSLNDKKFIVMINLIKRPRWCLSMSEPARGGLMSGTHIHHPAKHTKHHDLGPNSFRLSAEVASRRMG